MNVILETSFSGLKFFRRGKVRDIYESGDNLLIVSTDRLSAFDVIMNQGIPGKGAVLNKLSAFWLDYTKDIIENHYITDDPSAYPHECGEYKNDLKGRSMLVKRSNPLPVECIVRGYISGSGWNDYKETGSISGINLPAGLRESDKLPEPVFTPSTKAEIGEHDMNISHNEAAALIGRDLFEKVAQLSVDVYKKCAEYALTKGIIIADTKMEFGTDENGELMLIDEVLTPDSSRFWSVEKYEPGRAQDSFDKQFVRDYLLSVNFNKRPPAPDLPQEIISKTTAKYISAYEILTGKKMEL